MLFGQWGFSDTDQQVKFMSMCYGNLSLSLLSLSLSLSLSLCSVQGLTVLLHGPPGTGKSFAAEAIGYEVGKPLKVS